MIHGVVCVPIPLGAQVVVWFLGAATGTGAMIAYINRKRKKKE